MKNWRVKSPNTFDCEFGFSCMGYEIAAGWGAAMADPTRTPIVMVGDGTYMMMNSDIYSTGADRPQDDRRSSATMAAMPSSTGCRTARAAPRFNNLHQGLPREAAVRRRLRQARRIDGRARPPGRKPRRSRRRRSTGPRRTDRTTVITIVSDAFTWTPGDAWWDVGVPQVSARESVREASKDQTRGPQETARRRLTPSRSDKQRNSRRF